MYQFYIVSLQCCVAIDIKMNLITYSVVLYGIPIYRLYLDSSYLFIHTSLTFRLVFTIEIGVFRCLVTRRNFVHASMRSSAFPRGERQRDLDDDHGLQVLDTTARIRGLQASDSQDAR